MRARGEDVSFRDVKIKIPVRIWGCEWRHTLEACAEDFGGFEKSQSSWVLPSEEKGWLSLAHRGLVADDTRVGGTDGKASIEILCLSPYVEKPLNSKVIKSFVPELRSRKCFCVSGFLCSMYICYEHSTYVSHIRIMGMLQIYSVGLFFHNHIFCLVFFFLNRFLHKVIWGEVFLRRRIYTKLHTFKCS